MTYVNLSRKIHRIFMRLSNTNKFGCFQNPKFVGISACPPRRKSGGQKNHHFINYKRDFSVAPASLVRNDTRYNFLSSSNQKQKQSMKQLNRTWHFPLGTYKSSVPQLLKLQAVIKSEIEHIHQRTEYSTK